MSCKLDELSRKKFRRILKRFRSLKGWSVRLCKPTKSDKAKTAFYCPIGRRKAVIYGYGSAVKPVDFELHEVLHIALKEHRLIDRRKHKKIYNAEETLVQDICGVFCDELQRYALLRGAQCEKRLYWPPQSPI